MCVCVFPCLFHDPPNSSFWNQFGPNCTTWLVAAEVFPTDVRGTFQGISAAMGKVRARSWFGGIVHVVLCCS